MILRWRHSIRFFLCVFVLLKSVVKVDGWQPQTLLSDVETPAFLIDVRELNKIGPSATDSREKHDKRSIFPILTPQMGSQSNTLSGSSPYQTLLRPINLDPASPYILSQDRIATDGEHALARLGVCYIHTSVTRARDKRRLHDESESFLAELDLKTNDRTTDEGQDVLSSIDAKLVLGLNNHHVISYYWARSAGGGSCMEAPGVALVDNRLEWENQSSFTDCNSNDGKRSEWVAFLRPGDTVQLVPRNPVSTLWKFLGDGGDEVSLASRVYGISTVGRPLGSEPAVVCQWALERAPT